jgi:hypothetical protein
MTRDGKQRYGGQGESVRYGWTGDGRDGAGKGVTDFCLRAALPGRLRSARER